MMPLFADISTRPKSPGKKRPEISLLRRDRERERAREKGREIEGGTERETHNWLLSKREN